MSNASVANISEASYPSTFDLTETTSNRPNTTIRLKAADIENHTVPGDTDIALATVVFTGGVAGKANLTITVEGLDDDFGEVVPTVRRNGTLAVKPCSPLASDLPAPTDPDGDGLYEDTNGNGRFDFDDIVTLFEELSSAQPGCMDFNQNGRMDFDDIVTLFEEI